MHIVCKNIVLALDPILHKSDNATLTTSKRSPWCFFRFTYILIYSHLWEKNHMSFEPNIKKNISSVRDKHEATDKFWNNYNVYRLTISNLNFLNKSTTISGCCVQYDCTLVHLSVFSSYSICSISTVFTILHWNVVPMFILLDVILQCIWSIINTLNKHTSRGDGTVV